MPERVSAQHRPLRGRLLRGRVPSRGPRARQTSQAAELCLRMLKGALVGAHLGLLLGALVGVVLAGALGAANAVLAAALVMAFFASGQGVQLLAQEMADGTGMALVLVSYLVRVGLLAALLWYAGAHSSRLDEVFVRPAFWWGAALAVAGWVAGILAAHARSRVFAYDSDYRASLGSDTRSGDAGARL